MLKIFQKTCYKTAETKKYALSKNIKFYSKIIK